jgi:hypothetical protein
MSVSAYQTTQFVNLGHHYINYRLFVSLGGQISLRGIRRVTVTNHRHFQRQKETLRSCTVRFVTTDTVFHNLLQCPIVYMALSDETACQIRASSDCITR